MVEPQRIISGLVQRGVPAASAVGITANLGIESKYDPGINEIAPLVPGSRGGFGLAQWTGPRRRQFEAYAGDNLADLDTQLDFLVHELNTTEKRARDAIYSASDPVEAARLTSEKFLRPGIPHLDRRIEEARKLAGLPMPSAAPPMATQGAPQAAPVQAPSNALAYIQPPQYQNALSVQDFMLPTNQNALSQRGLA